MAVDIPVYPQEEIDIYLDDFITFIHDIGNNIPRVNVSMPLTIHTVSQPLAQKEPVLTYEMINPSKAKAEGELEEIKFVL